MNTCEKIPLSELMTQHTTVEKISDMKNERYITLSSNGNGAHERLIKDEKYPVPFSGYRVSEGQFIYSRIDARNGAYDIIPSELDGFVVSKDFPVFDVDTSKVLPRFLLRSVLSNGFIEQVKHSSFGATNRMRIKEDVFGSYSIRIPPLDVQNNIVECLDKAQSIIKYRREEIVRLDELIKARFVEMFGKPELNEFGWTMKSFGDICTVRQGLQIPISKRLTEYEENCYEYITVQYLHGGKAREYIKNPKASVICTKDDILMTRTGNTGMVVTDVAGAFHNNFFLIDFDRNLYTKNFLVHYLNLDMIQADIIRRAGTSTIPDLNHGEFYKVKIYEPPIDLQNQFDVFTKQVDKSKSVVQKSLDEAQLLFDSLMQQYFG